MSKSPFNTYYGAKNFTGHRPKDWWNHLIKDRQAPAGYPADGMLSSKILGLKNKDSIEAKYGDQWNKMTSAQ